MPEYRVVWEIDIEANSPEQAARLAEDEMKTPGCRYFRVQEHDMPEDELINLDEEED